MAQMVQLQEERQKDILGTAEVEPASHTSPKVGGHLRLDLSRSPGTGTNTEARPFGMWILWWNYAVGVFSKTSHFVYLDLVMLSEVFKSRDGGPASLMEQRRDS
jgi:hypothetical protein